MRGLLGIGVILLLAWGLSENRARIPWRVVVAGVVLQFGLAVLFLTFPLAGAAFLLLNRAVEGLLGLRATTRISPPNSEFLGHQCGETRPRYW